MSHNERSGRRRRGCFTLLIVVVAALLAYQSRERLLAALGGFLVVRDPLAKADVILVLSGEPTERAREAADLYREGWAPKVVLTTPEPPPGHAELVALGVRIPLEPEIARTIVVGLGVSAADVLQVPTVINSTGSEARAFHAWMREGGWRRAIVVSSPYHTRRVRSLFREVFGKSGTTVAVVPSRHGEFQPGDWWRRRSGVRNLIIEYQKLLFYSLQYPLRMGTR